MYILNATLSNTDSPAYSLTCKNSSSCDWTFYMYQKLLQQSDDVFSLAWLVSPYKMAPNSEIRFEWTEEYCFVWYDAKMTMLQPGNTFFTGGYESCSVNNENFTTFDLLNGVPKFSVPTNKGEAGSFTIQGGKMIPNRAFATGIGMSEIGTIVQAAFINTPQKYNPKIMYYVAVSNNDLEKGTILEQTIPQSIQVIFGENIYKLTAVLKEDNTWEIN
ncbi:hypothetical protein [Propionispira raffinosivorans]|uniref:hypothetical protein n=1 Tax=Propionispira raffinosivorans TaxID=86959 RepID=UPI000374155C|nr:hypothetical protein [Propionispira raffinosivorans]